MLTQFSRFVLYGGGTYDMRNKPTMMGWAWGHGQNFLRRSIGLHEVSAPGLVDFARHYVDRYLLEWMGIGNRGALPGKWPSDVFSTIDRIVKARGGVVQVGNLTLPAFSLNRKTALSLSSMWVAYVDFNGDGADFNRIKSLEEALEDAISRECHKDLNLRILTKPARIEIDNPNAATITLQSKWSDYLSGKVGAYRYLCGVESTPAGDALIDNRIDNANEYSCAWFGASGSGKTQSMTAALLTLCATTSPEELSVIVIDPKGLDFPVGGLPHLALDIVTDPALARNVVLDVANLLTDRAKRKDRSASRCRVLLVIDELAYLLQQQKQGELEQALVSIGAMGRAWGISMFIGSQRATNEFFPKSIHSQIPAKWVGRVKDASEASFASGQPGCDAHKLPGKGAAMLYEPDGIVRLQSPFIGDASKDNYPSVVAVFIKAIVKRWEGKQPHWLLGPAESAAAPAVGNLTTTVEDAVRRVLLEMANVHPAKDDAEPVDTTLLDTLPDGMLDLLEEAHDAGRLNKQRVKEISLQLTGKQLKHAKATEIFDAFTAYIES